MATWKPDRMAVHRTARAKGYEVVRSVAGPVLRDARYLAPRGTHRHGSGTAVAGKRLADSLIQAWSETPRFITSDVGSDLDYAATVARGSRPHAIRPIRKRFLVFEWERGRLLRGTRGKAGRGGLFFFKKVRHPGNKRPVRYLQTPLALWGRRANMKVTTVGNSRTRLP